LGFDYFRHDPSRHALVGERTGKRFKLGDVLNVRLTEAAPLTGGLRFELTPAQPTLDGRKPWRKGRKPATVIKTSSRKR
jgi:ribonuclease R